MINRRDFLRGGSLALATFAATRAMARTPGAAPTPLGGPLNIPDFSLLAADWRRAGLRPSRKGGVRLEVDRGSDIAPGRTVIHNYGHGGAGITLAWGSADKVRDLALAELRDRLEKAPADARAVIIGAGAIGLATADALKRWTPGMTVSVMAGNVDDAGNPLPRQTTSWIAGGQFEPSGLWREYADPADPARMTILHDLIRRSYQRIQALKGLGVEKDYGVADRRNYILAWEDDQGFAQGIPRDVIPAARTGFLPFAPLATVQGKEYLTWLINPTILLPKLVSDLRAVNVRFEKRTIRTRADLLAIDADIIVNCTGLGAGAMLGDRDIKPKRGQLVVLDNPNQLDWLFSGGCGDKTAYMFCRQDDIVIGGTFDDSGDLSGLSDRSYLAIRDRMQRIFGGDVSFCT